jgi:hypothetical protein
MVVGLDKFREKFSEYMEDYILIGGTACFLLFEEAGLEFRVTKDLDIVLCLDVLSRKFIDQFREFIKEGKYQNAYRSDKKVFYRFEKPEDVTYPDMIELFSGKPDGVALNEDNLYTPVTVNDEIVSLSALLLDQDYREIIMAGKTVINKISVLKAEYILLLKAKAWLDMTQRKAAGEEIDSRNISKHLKDVFRLFRLFSPEMRLSIPETVKADLRLFITRVSENPPLDLKPFGIRMSFEEVIRIITQIYGIAEQNGT